MTTDPAGGPPSPGPPPPPPSIPPPPPPAPPRPTPPFALPPAKQWKLSTPLFGALGLGYVTWMVWARTGSRVSLFVCIAALVAAAVDLVWSQVVTAKVRATVVGNPVETHVGDSITLTVRLEGPRQLARVGLWSLQSDEVAVEVPATVPFRVVPSSRQVATEVTVEIIGSGIASLLTVLRRRTVPLARPMYVGPRPIPAADPFPDLLRIWGEGEARPAPSGDLVRGVRPYVPGDPQRRVHWHATARVGDLVVKEVEDIDAPRILIALDLGGGGAAGERAAGRAAWYAEEAMRRGYSVVLATAELIRRSEQKWSHPVTAPVTSTSDVTRRLAAAAAPGKPDLPALTEVGAVLLVTDRGDSWR